MCSSAIHCKNKKCSLSRGKSRHDFEEIEKKIEELGYDFSKVKGNIIFNKAIIQINKNRDKK